MIHLHSISNNTIEKVSYFELFDVAMSHWPHSYKDHPKLSQFFQWKEEWRKYHGEYLRLKQFELDNLDTARFINDTELENCSGTIFNKSELTDAELEYVKADKDALAVLKLKIDSNNCVILSAVEEKMYSRKEVETLVRSALYTDFKAGTNMRVESNDWIKENL